MPQIRGCAGCGGPAANGAWCYSCEREHEPKREPLQFLEWNGPWEEDLARAIDE